MLYVFVVCELPATLSIYIKLTLTLTKTLSVRKNLIQIQCVTSIVSRINNFLQFLSLRIPRNWNDLYMPLSITGNTIVQWIKLI